jgi:integrase
MSNQNLILEGNAYQNFVNTIKSQVRVEDYEYAIKKYMTFLNVTDINNLLAYPYNQDAIAIQRKIIDYILCLRNKKLSAITIMQYIGAVVHFYLMNDITLNRKKIGMFIPEYVKNQKDRAYTTQEISQLLKFCDERAKALVLLFASTGIRIGAVPDLKLKHLQKIPEHNLYQISVYYGFKEEYYCFTTPEAAKAIDDYLQYRELRRNINQRILFVQRAI